ncbi:S-layer homology domain-containing protein [Clostridium cochlearium]|uniref:S-layer homology domain-containing protein n=1 Tax=Clostridium cochlearium TaxID=1494 RepID=UPI001EE09FB7|nr:S-layer homology domain-containing protein [Clostridium cochlearium]MBV1818511.1 S-layer homology domain-containing protein [Bacteroidales bacterium MSK.15.36]MCG4580297.1 S-layer homology domain-containing protein [Clostridium cochlearium]
MKRVRKISILSLATILLVTGINTKAFAISSDERLNEVVKHVAVKDHVKSLDQKLDDKKHTDYSKLILALTAIGKNPRNVGRYNLLTALKDYSMYINPKAGIQPTGKCDERLNEVVEDTAKFMYRVVPNPQVGSIGGEWAVIGLARSGYKVPNEYYHKYYATVEDYVKSLNGELHDKKYTEYSRLIVALTTIGKDPRNVGGYNLLTALGDYDKTIWQGLNGPIWALIALDSGNYPMPQNPKAKTQATREMYINRILECQLPDGGWSLFGGTKAATKNEKSDPDITGMALQALAKYQHIPEVKKATEEALECMSKQQGENGGYFSWGSENSESCVQIIVALTELGIPLDDERFVKNGNTLIDNLLIYYKKGNGFLHTLQGNGSNQMASEQGFYGVVAAKRAMEGKNSLYRMSDAIDIGEPSPSIGKSKGLENKHKDINVMPIVKPGTTFEDITGVNAHKNQTAIESLASRLIVNGRSENKFEPNANITRAEFATAIVKALGIEPKGENVFKDVKKSDWFFDYVATANKYGIVKGISKDEFKPNATVTKQEAAIMLAHAAKLAGMDTENNNGSVRDSLSQFEDYVTVDTKAMPSLAFCYSENILDDSSMKIEPKKNITRAEAAQMIFNMLGKANLL